MEVSHYVTETKALNKLITRLILKRQKLTTE